MYKGIVGSESLENPLILNSFRPVRIVIEYSQKEKMLESKAYQKVRKHGIKNGV